MRIAITTSETIQPDNFEKIYLWNGGLESQTKKSVPIYLENNYKKLRKRYLDYIDQVGSRTNGAISLKERLKDKSEFSHWYMMSIFEKNPQKTDTIYDALRCFAIEELLMIDRPSDVMCFGLSMQIKDVIVDLCGNLGVNISYKAINHQNNELLKFKVFIKGLSYLLVQPLFKLIFIKKSPQINTNKASTLMFAYQISMIEDVNTLEKDISKYWGNLPEIIKKGGGSIRWVHIPITNHIWSPARKSLSVINKLNKKSNNESHTLLGANFTFKVFIRIFIRWTQLLIIEARIKDRKQLFCHENLNLWPIYKKIWYESLIGIESISNIYFRETLKNLIQIESNKKYCLYLYEGQPWEYALVHSWKRSNWGKIVGAQHSSIGRWNLNNFNCKDDCFPDLIAVNGNAAKRELSEVGIPKNRMISVEAVRYLYLQEYKNAKKNINSNKKVLVLGDIDKKSTNRMLENLMSVIESHKNISYSYRPHPGCKLDKKNLNKSVKINDDESIKDALLDFNKIIAANGTSAALDAYLMGLDVIVENSELFLNLNPLVGHPGSKFYKNSEELNEFLDEKIKNYSTNRNIENFFYLDGNLQRWRALIDDLASSR